MMRVSIIWVALSLFAGEKLNMRLMQINNRNRRMAAAVPCILLRVAVMHLHPTARNVVAGECVIQFTRRYRNGHWQDDQWLWQVFQATQRRQLVRFDVIGMCVTVIVFVVINGRLTILMPFQDHWIAEELRVAATNCAKEWTVLVHGQLSGIGAERRFV